MAITVFYLRLLSSQLMVMLLQQVLVFLNIRAYYSFEIQKKEVLLVIGSRFFYGVVILGLLLVPLAFAVPVNASTPFPGEIGKIAFSKTVKGVSNIWVMNSNGTNQRALTHSGAHNPVWSPNGRKLVFVGSNNRLRIMNANGSGQRDLTHSQGYGESSPVWSADGSRIAFVRGPSNSQGNAIFAIKPDGTGELNLSGWASTGGYRAPSWAPDGNQLVYERYGADELANGLFIKNLKSGTTKKLTTISDSTNSSQALWSPNGKKILFSDSSNEVYTIWPDGSHRTVISDGDSFGASWSPSGNRVAFLEDSSGESISISEANGDITWVPLQKGRYQEISPPSWSPDGTKLVFALAYTGENGRVWDIFSLDLKGDFAMTKLASGESDGLNWQARPAR